MVFDIRPRASAASGWRFPQEQELTPALVVLVILSAVPAFMLRATGVMDDSVFWVVSKSLDSGNVLYRDVFFTQPPLFIFVPQAVWMVTTNVFVHRAFLLAVWLANGGLFYLAADKLDRIARPLATGALLVSAFILQSYALHTEIFVLTAFLVAILAIAKRAPARAYIIGLVASAALFIKPPGLLVFLPVVYRVLEAPTCRTLRLTQMLAGAAIPAVAVTAYLVANGTALEFWQQVVIDNGKVGLSLSDDWSAYFTLVVAPLLLPIFVGLVLVDGRPRDVDWWLTLATFSALLAIEILRGARHYGLLALCVLAWMAVRAQGKLAWSRGVHRLGLGAVVALAVVFQISTVREILIRGSIRDELAAAKFVQTLPPGSLHVFGNSPPRIYMLMNDLRPAFRYVFVYDTNKDQVNWDSYMTMIEMSPPDYIAVDDSFTATEYGQQRSSHLTDANAVRAWIESQRTYRRLEVGGSLGLTMYQRLALARGGTES